ncbi:la-related protein 7 [Drosophila guanche]|uniref:La-related protein 7 n=1 Tax=Drosophila guanche TaxID=7266 RepID=A0A3B0K5M8_DROGU|nr:la-related protein 7 [Drosophila guanche]SPP88593.1 blast:La-related protein 7 [Drosophila guanche]
MAAKAATASDKDEGQEQEKAATKDQMEPMDAKETDAESNDPAKRDAAAAGGRKRKRHLYNSIRSQMEFYFGDANLTKDRFLRRYVDQDPYVPLEIFLTFNKIKPLAQDVMQIAKALNNSQLLELDESRLKVRRKTKLPDQRDVNDKTLYVEALPANASHDWLKEVFSRYGPVAYVSLPHYPGTKKIKEFAFIEFERSTALEKAVKAFAQVQGVLSLDTDPAVLASVRSFQQQQQQEKNVDAPLEDGGTKRGRKREAKEESHHHDVKRVKLEQQPSDTSTAEETASESEDQEAAASAPEQQEEASSHDEQPAGDGKGETIADADADEAKKRRRKRKKKAIIDKPNIDPTAIELKVLPKASWCSLRNKYLNLQRRLVSEAKAKLWRESQQQQLDPNQPRKRTPMQAAAGGQQHSEQHNKADNGEECEPLSDVDDVVGGTETSVPVPPKRRKAVHKMNMNFYGAGGGETEDSRSAVRTEDPSQERTPLFKYEPGLIVECVLHEPCTNIKEFKADMRQYTDIKYVDIKEGDLAATLRMATPTAAEELVRQLSCAERQLKVLDGQAETLYWRKIEQDREAKLTKKVRVQQKRGREKVSKMLAKHTKFDDTDDDVAASCEPPSGTTTVEA